MRLPLPALLLLGGLLLWGGSCARRPVAPPETALPPAAGCDRTQLQLEMEQLESTLAGARGERANHLIRLGRICFLLGCLSPKEQKRDFYMKGHGFAEVLVREQPAWAEGHYWLALNLCGLADVGGAGTGLTLLPRIVEELERTLEVNPGYDQAGPHRILGRIYYEAPPWPLSVGDIHQSFKHLTQAVAISPENSTNHLYLAVTLLELGKKAQAREELEKTLRATSHALCPSHLEEDRREARRLLKENR